MSTSKIIYWREDLSKNEEGETYANVHLLVGYNQASLSDFLKMADELRETFPQATNEEIQGGKIFKSDTGMNDGHTIITWGAYIPKGEYPGWRQNDHGRIGYYW
jgi:hypothetical protein